MGKRINKETIPDVDITLTAQELKKLFNEPAELMKLYFFLNMRRDFDSNIAGYVTHINDSAFKEALGYAGKAGRKGWRPTTTHIVRWLEQLEDLGLIERLGNHVFKLPLACKRKTEKKISHQGVTKNVTGFVTNQETDKTPINIVQNPKIENDLSPDLSLQVSKQVYTPPINNYTKLYYTASPDFLTPEENKFLNLFTDLKLSLKLAGDLKALTTAKALVQAGVTLEVAREALEIKLAAYQGDRTPHPAYFKQAILDYQRDLDQIKQQPKDTPHAKVPTRKSIWQPNTNPNERVRKEIDSVPDEWDE